MTGGKAPRARGDRFEHVVTARLRALGFYVCRSAGSLGPADLVALRGDSLPLLINCKITDNTTTRIRRELANIANDAGALAIIATKPNRGKISWQRIDADGTRTAYDVGGLIWPTQL